MELPRTSEGELGLPQFIDPAGEPNGHCSHDIQSCSFPALRKHLKEPGEKDLILFRKELIYLQTLKQELVERLQKTSPRLFELFNAIVHLRENILDLLEDIVRRDPNSKINRQYRSHSRLQEYLRHAGIHRLRFDMIDGPDIFTISEIGFVDGSGLDVTKREFDYYNRGNARILTAYLDELTMRISLLARFLQICQPSSSPSVRTSVIESET